jgi:hypothetical protein
MNFFLNIASSNMVFWIFASAYLYLSSIRNRHVWCAQYPRTSALDCLWFWIITNQSHPLFSAAIALTVCFSDHSMSNSVFAIFRIRYCGRHWERLFRKKLFYFISILWLGSTCLKFKRLHILFVIYTICFTRKFFILGILLVNKAIFNISPGLKRCDLFWAALLEIRI